MTNNNKTKIIKVAAATLMIFSFFLITCSLKTSSKIETPSKIKFIYNIPIVKLNGELVNISDSLSIFYLNDDILYKFPFIKALENATSITNQEIKFKYFLYRKGQPYGYYYDSINTNSFRKLAVDSLLAIKAFVGNKFYDKANDSLVEVRRNEEKFSLIEKYVSKVKLDQSYPDTTIIYYKKNLKNIDYTFSKELDSIKKLKICQIRIVYNSQFYKGYSFKLPQREFRFELKDEFVEDSKSLINFFIRFREDMGNN